MICKKQQFSDAQELVMGSISIQNEPASINEGIGISLMNKDAMGQSGGFLCTAIHKC